MTTSNVYRIYNDTSHFVGIKYVKQTKDNPIKNNEASIKDFKSEYCLAFGDPQVKSSGKKQSWAEHILEEAYLYSLEFQKKERLSIMVQYLKDNNHSVPDFLVVSYLRKKNNNLISRIDRFKKKALNNKWNFFITITYDDNKLDEETFIRKLKKCLANLHTRNGYKYMGVFERSKTGRLHFHALIYIPKMIQTDNGQEFTYLKEFDKKHMFDLFCETHNIIHKLIKPRTPRHNGKVERSHRNDNERFYKYLKFYSFEDLKKQMKVYLGRSNNIPTSVLGWKTPIEKRKELLLIDLGVVE